MTISLGKHREERLRRLGFQRLLEEIALPEEDAAFEQLSAECILPAAGSLCSFLRLPVEKCARSSRIPSVRD